VEEVRLSEVMQLSNTLFAIVCIYITNVTNYMFHGLTHGDSLSPLLFNFPLEYVIRRLHGNQEGLKLIGTRQLLVYACGVNVLGGSVHTINKNTEV
jgi:hypothetical protein